MIKNHHINDLNETGLNDEFKSLALGISQHCQSYGLNVIPYLNEKLPYFSALSSDFKKMIVSQLRNQLDLYDAAVVAGMNLRNSGQLTWQAVRKFGYVPCHDFFDKIESTDVVEIYAVTETTFMQIFRDLNFYAICSYSIEELVSRPLDELVERDPAVVADIMKWGHLLFTQQVKSTVIPEINKHLTKEINSIFKYQVELILKYYSPLFDQNKNVIAVAVVASAQVLNLPSTLEKERMLADSFKREHRPDLQLI